MNAIILAAGEGKRLRPLTNDKPKCLVELFGKTLLEWQLAVFKKCGINDICVVTGYNSQMFRYPNLDYIKNENYKTTNMMESLFCAKERFSQSTIVSYGGIIFEEKILRKSCLVSSKFTLPGVVWRLMISRLKISLPNNFLSDLSWSELP